MSQTFNTDMLSSFPHLSGFDFDKACTDILHTFQRRRDEQSEWLTVERFDHHEVAYLRITKELQTRTSPRVDAELDNVDIEEVDEEVLQNTTAPTPVIHYDITLSPIYRVPLLYFGVSDPLHRYPPTMSILYEHLIPPQFKAQTENVGVIGGITINDHPATNRPVFFIHPCQTAEVMEATVGKIVLTAEDYLMIWIGALGKCVGLNVPLALVRKDLECCA